MATVTAIPMSPTGPGHTPMVSTFDPSFSPGSLHLAPFAASSLSDSFLQSSPASLSSPAVPMGSRYEKVPYSGPGSATYVRQPTRAQLKENNGVFHSPNRPYYYRDPSGAAFIDIDGKVSGERWIYVDPLDGVSPSSSKACCIM
ncbi:uncharacterized protein JCM6883_005537 [Sporobolomyces salmoneus]|uniref:uncharacterized protein n=1 Tax=Sporobolomyces salmoneus TaxID=183962 RepID=UPI003175E34E